jgi:hypothetical protein
MREGGKEPATGWTPEILGELNPLKEHFLDVRGGWGFELLHFCL